MVGRFAVLMDPTVTVAYRQRCFPHGREWACEHAGVVGLGVIAEQLRIRQWPKNLLVLAAPAAGGVLLEPGVLVKAGLAFLAFSLIASALYIVNDIVDADSDRQHPRKKSRPIASGRLRTSTGWAIAGLCVAAGAAIAALLPSEFGVTLAVYALSTALYTYFVKSVPTLEMLLVAVGFVLRAVGGAAATGVQLSQWFLGVAMFGSLLIVAGKRTSELKRFEEPGATRAVLRSYSSSYLHQVGSIAAGGTLLTYALWALSDEGTIANPWALLSFGPFLFGVLRYMQLTDAGQTETPEALAATDPGMLAGGVVWVVILAAGLYL